MRIILIHPGLGMGMPKGGISELFPSVGLGYLAASIQSKMGLSVQSLDCLSVYLQGGSIGDSTSIRQWAQCVEMDRPDIVGFTTTSHTRIACLALSRAVKRMFPESIVVWGGPFATLQYETVLEHWHDAVDYVVRGEGEVVFPQLLNEITYGNRVPEIPGVSYLRDGAVKPTSISPILWDLDNIPSPNYSEYALLAPDGRVPTVAMVSTRGCPYGCAFCGSAAFWGNPVRFRSPANVVEEMAHHHARYGTVSFKFHDDTFTVDRNHALGIFQEITRRRLHCNLYIHTRIESMDFELLRAYKQAGGQSVFYGLETASPPLRLAMGKECVNFSLLIRNSRHMREMGIRMGIFVLLGYPGETVDDVRQTFDLLNVLQPDDVYVSSTKIQPGTKLAKAAKGAGVHRDEDWLDESRQTLAVMDNDPEYTSFIQGCILLLDEMYRRSDLRSNFENNQEAAQLRNSGADCGTLKRNALDILRKAGRRSIMVPVF